jgi:hypothetical protein
VQTFVGVPEFDELSYLRDEDRVCGFTDRKPLALSNWRDRS